MAPEKRIVEILSKLNLSILADEWVKSAWETEFLDPDPLPDDFVGEIGSISLKTELPNVIAALVPWVEGTQGSSGEGLWTILIESDISHKKLIAYLFALMNFWKNANVSAQLQLSAVHAASVYLVLLTVPGSGAFKIFNAEIFDKTLSILQSWESIGTSKRKMSVSNQGRSGRNKRRSKETSLEVSEDEEEEEGDTEDKFLPKDLDTLHKTFKQLLMNLVKLLSLYSLKSCDMAVEKVVNCLVRSLRIHLEAEAFKIDINGDISKISSTMNLAFKGLHLICLELQGNVKDNSLLVFRLLLPSVLMVFGDDQKSVAAQTIPRQVQLLAHHVVNFIGCLLQGDDGVLASSVRILLQQLCVKVPDKADYRSKVAQHVAAMLKKLPEADKTSMMQWIHKYSKNYKISYRSFALDLISILINEYENPQNVDMSESTSSDEMTQRTLIYLLVGRCSDVAPSVRARAIAALAKCTCTKQPCLIQTIQDIITPACSRTAVTRVVPTPDMLRVLPLTAAKQSEATSNTFATPSLSTADVSLPDAQGLVSMLIRRAGDGKVHVRKAAIQAIEGFVRLLPVGAKAENMSVIAERCQDPAVSVRKQAMSSLSDLLIESPLDSQIQKVWLEGTLPLVVDRESSVQEKCHDVLEELLFSKIVAYNKMNSDSHRLAWNLLNIIASDEHSQLRPYLQKVCLTLGKKGTFKMQLYKSIETHCNTENNLGAWMLLAVIASHAPKLDASFVLDYWKEKVTSIAESEYSTIERVLEVLAHFAKNLSQESISFLIDDLKARLMDFVLPPQVTSAIITTLSKLCEALCSDELTCTQSNTQLWFHGLLQQCVTYLSEVVLSDAQCVPQEDRLISYLFTLGEIAQLCPDKIPRRVYMLVQSLVASPSITSTDASSQNASGSSQEFQVLSQFRGSNMSPKIRAYAFICLGKLCLQNEDLAKSVIAALARELDISDDIAVRNNVIIIMGDLCVRYTNMVDRYVSSMMSCLRDPSSLIRKQTLTILTRLLQEDYLKWRGPLFYQYVVVLVDADDDIAGFCEFCLLHLLLQRHPTMFFNHFVECIYHYNSYDDHKTYNKFTQNDKQKKLFSLEGKHNFEKRMKIYKFLLAHMQDNHKFQLTAKLTQDILGAVVDETIPFNAKTELLLEDCLQVLTCKEIKLASLRSNTQDEIAETDTEMAAVVLNVAKKNLISQVMKKNIIENIIPTVISLKHLLDRHHSPALKWLMLYLCDVMKNYKNEVKDFLAADQQMEAEIQYDLKRFEEQQKAPLVSPQGQGVRSPARERLPLTQQSGSPRNNLASPANQSLVAPPKNPDFATLAILNSARKAMAARAESTGAPLPATPRDRRSSSDQRKRVGWAEDEEEINVNETAAPSTPPPNLQKNSRAISTPSANVTMSNITFMPGDLSMIAASPALAAGNKENHGTRRSSKASKGSEKELILMMSPEQPRPKPKVWNVQSRDSTSASDSSPPPQPSRRSLRNSVVIQKKTTKATNNKDDSVSSRTRRSRRS